MNSREELLQRLYGAKDIIEEAERITRKYYKIKGELLPEKTYSPSRDVLSGIMTFIIFGVMFLISGFFILAFLLIMATDKSFTKTGIVMILIALAVDAVLAIVLRKDKAFRNERHKNREIVIAKQNEEIERYNLQVLEKAEAVNREMEEIQKIAGQRIYGWYPPNYMYSDAVIFFIEAIQNFKANNIQEAVNLYDRKLFEDEQLEIQRGISEMQREQNRLQKIQNVLSAGNLFANLGTAYNTGRAADDIRDIKNHMNRTSPYYW